MGSVAGALGIGGVLGTLANGVNVGGASSTGTSTTTYSQRVISIPPMASVSLEPQSIGRGHIFEAVGRHKYYDNIELSCNHRGAGGKSVRIEGVSHTRDTPSMLS